MASIGGSIPVSVKALNTACGLTVIGVWIEKGIGLVIPGFVPTPIGEIYEFAPSFHEVAISVGVWGLGLLLFTLLAKAGIPLVYPKNHKAT